MNEPSIQLDPYQSDRRTIFANIKFAFYRILKIAISLAYYFGRTAWHSILRIAGRSVAPRLTILYYHGVSDSNVLKFVRQMDSLLRSANIVPANFIGTLPSDKINVAITFDDAFKSTAENALPALAARSFHCTIFVPVGLIGREPNWETEDRSAIFQEVVMTSEQLKALSRTLVSLGSHGVSHARLSMINRSQARYEIEQSRYKLMDITGCEVDQFAFPYGDCDECLIEMCKSAGYRHVYTSEYKSIHVENYSLLRGRIKVDPFDSRIEFFLKIRGAYSWLSVVRLIKSKVAASELRMSVTGR